MTQGTGVPSFQRLVNKVRRIIEGPPVREKTIVKVVDPSARKRCPPCFLIGVYRSGTTLLRFVLDSHSRIAVPPETNFLSGLAELYGSQWMRKGLRGVGVDEDGLLERLRDFAWTIYDDYTLAKGKARWVDKTPSYVDILDFIDLLFGPECRFIMLYRHGLDVAQSMAVAYSNNGLAGPAKLYADLYVRSPRLAFTLYWADQCRKMMDFERRHPQRCHRIRYEDYAADPKGYLPAVFEFLGEEWEPHVLDYHKTSHDFGLQDHKIETARGFKPKTGTYRHWDRAETAEAARIAATVLEQLGYRVP
ncbi:Sulfotransferase family protein [Desulfacinum hydrothermale DSM 13146]|uniref:Sulfotransferase family protein n=1 Tax=Desulfacinum hydrothermale DSM 13146 TaxID=1121390 RepID=A0A1W1XR15_9BACT|nr:sulfotransferase [Desulfacinum hydrothermale]SMC26302.1 Sulfotransferase family protein [Desulfacinum hydrothermale DSM 13146]